MKRIDSPTRAINLHGTGKDGFRDGATPGTEPTDLNEDWFNGVQEEIAGLIESSGLTLNGSDLGQLGDALAIQLRRAALTNWNVVAMSGAVLNDVCYGGGQYVLVGDGGAIFTSKNGLVWEAQSAAGASTSDWHAVAYSPTLSLWVIAGGDGEIQTSPDGEAWTARTAGSGYDGNFRAAVWASDRFVLVGGTNDADTHAQTSPDGIVWTDRTMHAGTARTNYAIAYNPTADVLIAVGYDAGAAWYRSTDKGVSWTASAIPAGPQLRCIAWNATLGLWCVAGGPTSGVSYIATSTNGTGWQTRDAPEDQPSSANAFYRAACVTPEGIFVLLGYSGETDQAYIAHSRNGIDWLGVDIYDATEGEMNSLATDGKHVLAVGGTDTGNDWVMRSHGFAG